jgi:predicted dehydrogenase
MNTTTRRGFLAGAAAAVAPAPARTAGANNRLRVGVIGCGGMATHHMKMLVEMKESDNVEVAAVCDIYTTRLEAAAALTGGRPFKDYRGLLEDKDVDYVLIATPEHWHYQMTIDAIDAGKHIYCEKPMTQTADQARKVVAKIERTRLKMQVGVQGMSDDSYETANRYVREGALGRVVLAQIDYSRNHDDEFWAYPIDESARPGVDLDWNAWLGPAPKREWDPRRYFRWRHYWDYSSGIASDLFVHRVTRVIKALGLTFPSRGAALGGKFAFTESPAEVPDTLNVLLDYPEGLTVQLISTMANDVKVEHMLRGRKATLFFTPEGFQIRPQRLFEAEARQVTHIKSGAERVDLHHRNLMDAIRSGAELKCPPRLGWYGVVACEMGTQSYRRGKFMLWDARREKLEAA